jgi:pimeloyl-ACP methyl ester carboxylesterase
MDAERFTLDLPGGDLPGGDLPGGGQAGSDLPAGGLSAGDMARFGLPAGRIEAARWPGAGPPIVLLHEGLGCIALWRDFPARLAAATGRCVFAYSRFGYGGSSPVTPPRPLDYMHREAALLPRVLAAAGIGPAVLLGHSDGASIAAIHAGCGPAVAPLGLVLLAPHFFVENLSIAGIERARAAYLGGELRRRLAKYHADVDGAFWGWNGAWLDPAFRDWRIDGFLPAIRAPMLVVQGSLDEYGTVEQLRAAERLSGGKVETLLIEGARHAPQVDAPEATLEAVRSFLAALV